jgi:hypothetical protein
MQYAEKTLRDGGVQDSRIHIGIAAGTEADELKSNRMHHFVYARKYLKALP